MTCFIMSKRFWVGPLGKHDDDWLTVWAWLNNRSKNQQASSVISARIRSNKSEIVEMLQYTAKSLDLTPAQLMAEILDGTAPSIRDDR